MRLDKLGCLLPLDRLRALFNCASFGEKMAISTQRKEEAAESLAMEAYRLLIRQYRVSDAKAEKVADAVYEAVLSSLSKR